ncbi:PP2C family protein-serine/threonine phosphatase [Actinacidiphila glaucinigra]|uniref:PP2C family protein-serine/threonine phosphatase n=1 Tax=Actinacidiphila glaucinigra TaxID=235986 RepID=UPI0036E04B1A
MRLAPRAGTYWSAERNPALIAVPVLLIVAIVISDLLIPTEGHLGPLLVVAPALTASFGGLRLTALIGGLAVAALTVVSVADGTITTSYRQSEIIALVLVSAFTVLFVRLRERHQAELQQVRSVAEAAQQVVLQPLPELIGPLRIACDYQAAEDQARIGGDLYAAVRTPGGTRLLIGDVRGKGLPAIGDASLLLGAFRSVAYRAPPLPALYAHLEATVSWKAAQAGGDGPQEDAAVESFITAILVDFPDDRPEVRILNCGHPPPLRLAADGLTALDPSQPAPPIGLGLLQPSHPGVDTFPFAPGDILLLYTDGVTEARDGSGRFYPLAERVASWRGRETPEDLVRHVREDLLAYCGGRLGDDAALITVRRQRAGVGLSHGPQTVDAPSALSGGPEPGPSTRVPPSAPERE